MFGLSQACRKVGRRVPGFKSRSLSSYVTRVDLTQWQTGNVEDTGIFFALMLLLHHVGHVTVPEDEIAGCHGRNGDEVASKQMWMILRCYFLPGAHGSSVKD